MPAGPGSPVRWTVAGLITVYLVPYVGAVRHARRGRPAVLLRSAGVAARSAVDLGYVGWAVRRGARRPVRA